MGVKHFYFWYSRQYKNCIESVKPYPVNVLAIDMNGLFHTCAQKVYRYGSFAMTMPLMDMEQIQPRTKQTLLRQGVLPGQTMRVNPKKHDTPLQQQVYRLKLFQEVCSKVNDLVRQIDPTTTLVLCVDGVAGLGKMNQQRQRRFRSEQERRESGDGDRPSMTQLGRALEKIPSFNPNQFTPGTELMDSLTYYIDGYIRRQQTVDPKWKTLSVIFSNEKVAGEGEHKIMHYLRRHVLPDQSVCIFGMDADLVMLSMLLPLKKILIAREVDYFRHEYIHVDDFRKKVLNELNWSLGREHHEYSAERDDDPSSQTTASTSSSSSPMGHKRPTLQQIRFCETRGIQDFVMLCFLVGNDFLPTIPCLSIMDGGLMLMFQVYRRVCSRYGHLSSIQPTTGDVVLNKRSMGLFFGHLAEHEKALFENKYNSKTQFFHDPIVIEHSQRDSSSSAGRITIDIEKVRESYYTRNFPEKTSIETICHQYMDGMLWVANYYRTAMPDWLWSFPFLYGPFLCDMKTYWKSYTPKEYKKHQPVDPFLQLLMVLPPADQKDMVPSVLHMFHDPELQHFFPKRVEIDLAGKKKEWEGIVQIPPVPFHLFYKKYMEKKQSLPPQHARRNIRGKSFVYRYHPDTKPYTYRSPYISCVNCVSHVEPFVLTS